MEGLDIWSYTGKTQSGPCMVVSTTSHGRCNVYLHSGVNKVGELIYIRDLRKKGYRTHRLCSATIFPAKEESFENVKEPISLDADGIRVFVRPCL